MSGRLGFEYLQSRRGRDPGPHGCRSLEAFMFEPVSAKGPILPTHVISGRQVIYDGISGDIIERLRLADVRGFFPMTTPISISQSNFSE